MTDEITQNDCQGEDPFMAYYSKLSALEAKLFKAIGIAFQLKDFGHNVIDEIDGECFEQDVEQMDRFTAANKAALAAAMGIVNPELARLKAELREAREVIRPFAKIEPSSLYPEDGSENEPYCVILQQNYGNPAEITGAHLARARAFLTKGETDDAA